MIAFDQITALFTNIWSIATDPFSMILLFGSTLLGIIFGALPGLTATLGVALLTTVTYGMSIEIALIALLAIYVGAIYGGSYGSILVNIPGTPAAAATALDGYPLALKGQGGRALGLTTTASAIGTVIGMVFIVMLAPAVSDIALKFASFEFFLLAFLGIMLSGTLATPDTVIKGWIAGFLGLWLALVGRDALQFYPRFTFGIMELDSGIDVVPMLIGAFGIPQIISVLTQDKSKDVRVTTVSKVTPEWSTLRHNILGVVRASLIGVGIGAVPGLGEDIAAWVSYGAAKNSSKHPETFGKGELQGIVASETANNACIGGAIIPLLSLGIPGSPPAAMLLGAFILHGIQPGPMLAVEHPGFIAKVSAIIFLAAIAMWVICMLLVKHVVKVIQISPKLFMPVVAMLCFMGSYALGLKIFNLYLMVPIGLLCYFLGEMKYPVAPLVIGVILGSMADQSLRRGLMVSQGSLTPMLTRPVSLILVICVLLMFITQIPAYKRMMANVTESVGRLFHKPGVK
ncbi:MAG: tripartite tricarboxylate transporter permease [Treponemataceae bacterium]